MDISSISRSPFICHDEDSSEDDEDHIALVVVVDQIDGGEVHPETNGEHNSDVEEGHGILAINLENVVLFGDK